ncbi:MAG: tetratricopeptide repeat protein [Leptospirales bacterium]
MVEPNNIEKHFRYRGPLPYQDREVDRSMFFGRERETKKLLSLVLSERLTVLFAKSGLGKTSLINAGLMDTLRSKKYFPVRVTFNAEKIGLTESVLQAIEEKALQTGVKIKSPKKADRTNLWSYFAHTEFLFEKKKVTPLLILDQFEEIFTLYTREQTGQFIEQIAPIIRNIAPERSSKGKRKSSTDAYAKIKIKILIGIREDYLAELEGIAKKVPQILRNRYRLLPLNRISAKMAIENPVEKEGNFYSRTSKYSPEAIDKILNFLSAGDPQDEETRDEDTTIEPAQLQLVCQSIENQIIERDENENNIISKEDLGGTKGLQKIIKSYYNNKINKITPSSERSKARKLFKKGLISSKNNRVSLAASTIIDSYRLSEATLEKLVDARLLRSESRNKITYYEIPHDTLVGPIRQLQKERDLIIFPIYIAIPVVLMLSVGVLKGPLMAFFYEFEMDKALIDCCVEGVILPGKMKNGETISGRKIKRKKYDDFIESAINADRGDKVLEEYNDLINMKGLIEQVEWVFNFTKFSIISRGDTELLSKIREITADHYVENPTKGNPIFLYQLAKELHDNEQFEKAREVFLLVLESKSGFDTNYLYAEANYFLGDMLAIDGKCNAAKAYFDKVNQLNNATGRDTELIHTKCLETKQERSETYVEKKKDVELGVEPIEIKPPEEVLLENKGIEHAVELMHNGELNEAIDEFKKYIKENSDSAWGHYYLGALAGNDGEYKKAIVYLNTAIQIMNKDPKQEIDDTIARKRRAYYYLKDENYHRAIKDYKILLKKYPLVGVQYAVQIAYCYERLGERKKAIPYYDQAISMDKHNPQTYYKHARLSRQLGYRKDATYNYKKAIEIKPDYFEAVFELAEIYRDNANFTNAIKYYKLAYDIENKLFLKSRLAEMHRLYARELYVKMEYNDARTHYEKALKYYRYDKPSLDGLAAMHYEGKDTSQSYEEAFKLYSRSADLGSSTGQYYLGIMYLNGWGTSKSLKLAHEYFSRAAKQGHKEAAKKRDEVKSKLDKQERQKKTGENSGNLELEGVGGAAP